MTDNEIIRALESALKTGDEPIGKHWGCFLTTETAKNALDLINRQKAEIGRLTTLAELGSVRSNDYRAMRDKARNARAEAIKEFAERAGVMITEVYNKHIFGANDLEAEEKDAIINFSDDITSGLDGLVKEMTEEPDGKL